MTVIDMGFNPIPEPDWRRIITRKAERAAAAEHWRVITTEMQGRQTLSPANGPAILRLVLAMLMHDRAAAKALRTGPVNEPKPGNPRAIPRPSLYFTAMREAGALAAQLESDLGLSPRSRGRVAKVERPRIAGAAARYLKPVRSLPPPEPAPVTPITTPEKEPTE